MCGIHTLLGRAEDAVPSAKSTELGQDDWHPSQPCSVQYSAEYFAERQCARTLGQPEPKHPSSIVSMHRVNYVALLLRDKAASL